jgi:hypothetical protein
MTSWAARVRKEERFKPRRFAAASSFKKWLSDTIFGATYEGAGV